MRKRIVEVTKKDGSKEYHCERTGFFLKNLWRTMEILIGPDVHGDAIFSTLEEAKSFLGIADSQRTESKKVIWESE